jgi:hypothetical protein
MKFVNILKLFIFQIVKIVRIWNFQNCSYFEFVFNFEIINISIFYSNLKIVHILNFVHTYKKRKRKIYTVNLMGRGPTRHPVRAGYAVPRSRAANGRHIGAPVRHVLWRRKDAPHTPWT